MSLRWDTTNCPKGQWPGEEGTDEDWQWLQSLIFTMPAVHMHQLDVEEFMYRQALLHKLGWLTTLYPREVVERWEGMTVNVVPTTRAKFHNMTWRNFTSEVEREAKVEAKRAKREAQNQ